MDFYHSTTPPAPSNQYSGSNSSVLLIAEGLGATVAPPGPETEASISPPEVSVPVHYSVIITNIVLVGILFLLVYVQLIMIICFGYKLLSYQTVLLFDILLWGALRVTLYSSYFYHCCELVDRLSGQFVGWLLVEFPSALQYFSLAVLVHYFGASIFKVLGRRQEMSSLTPPYRKMKKYRILGESLWLASIIAFLAGNVTFYFLIGKTWNVTLLVIMRAVLLDGLFLIMGITLGVCIIIMYTTRAGKDVLDAQRGRKCVPLFISCVLILLFASRDIYAVVAVISDTTNVIFPGWEFATDEGDFEFSKDNKYGYIFFLIVLMIWEIVPTYIIVYFFRVRIPYHTCRRTLKLKPCKLRRKETTTNRRHFFENPNRYDENEQLLHHGHVQNRTSTTTHVSIPSLTGSIPPNHLYPYHASAAYGSTNSTNHHTKYTSINTPNHHHRSSNPPLSSVMPGTTPPQLFTSPSFFADRNEDIS